MATTKWVLDQTHSELQFKVKHMMVSTVTGSFSKFNGTVETSGNDITTAKVHFTADVSSISTNNEQRDQHLRSGDFFDTDNHPQITFDSTRVEKNGEDSYKVFGTLSMRGVSKEVSFLVDHGGIMQDPWGNTRTGFSVSGKVNRRDFGVSFSLISDTGNILLSDEVVFLANVQFVVQKQEELVA